MTDDSGFLVFIGIGLFFDSPFFCELDMKVKIITLCFLSVFAFPVFAQKSKAPIGNTHLKAEFDRSGFDKLMGKSFDVDKMVQRYESNATMKADIRGTANQVSSTKVDVNIKGSVSRKVVMANLFKNAKIGGKLAVRGLGWAGLAYTLVDALLVKEGWSYDEVEANWLRPESREDYVLIKTKSFHGWPSVDGGIYNKDSLKDLCANKDGCEQVGTAKKSELSAAKKKACSSVQVEIKGKLYNSNGYDIQDRCSFYDREVSSIQYVSKYYIKPVRFSNFESMSQSDFDDIVLPVADGNPTPYVDKSRPSEGAPVPGFSVEDKVQIKDGTVVSTSPYTNPQTGQAEQATWKFGRDASGQTTVKETVTPRPDLSPNSVEAPKTQESTATDFKTETQTGSQTQSGSQTQTGSKTQSDSETQSDSKTQDGTQTKEGTQTGSSPASNTGGKTESSGDKEDTKDKGFLCDLFPDILACDKLPDAGEDPELEIPSEVVNVEFQKLSVFQEAGQCPEPVLFEVNVMGASKTFGFSFEHVCSVAERIRFALIMFAWLVAAFWCLRTVSGDK